MFAQRGWTRVLWIRQRQLSGRQNRRAGRCARFDDRFRVPPVLAFVERADAIDVLKNR